MTSPTRMTPEESAFWRMESDARRMHGVTLAVLDGPAPGLDELRALVARCAAIVPRLRQKVVEVPLRLGRPMWVDDPDFDIDDHVVATTIATAASLPELVSLVVSRRLHRSAPLWQLTMVTGLDRGRWAIISQIHHSIIDGVSGTEPLAVMIDGVLSGDSPIEPWTPRRPPRPDELAGRAVVELLLNPIEQQRFGAAAINRVRRGLATVTGGGEVDRPLIPTGRGPSTGGDRAWASVTVALDPLREARRRHDTSLHQLVMLLVTSGLRAWLRARDEGRSSWPRVTAIVPMAVADPTAGFAGGISTEQIVLPVGEREIERRLDALPRPSASMSQPAPVEDQIGLAGLTAPTLASLGLRETARRGIGGSAPDVVVVNVPGPRQELTILGRPLVEIDPVLPLVAGAPVSVGVFSYLDRLTFGITTDRAAVPDVQVIATGIRSGFAEVTSSPLEPSPTTGPGDGENDKSSKTTKEESRDGDR